MLSDREIESILTDPLMERLPLESKIICLFEIDDERRKNPYQTFELVYGILELPMPESCPSNPDELEEFKRKYIASVTESEEDKITSFMRIGNGVLGFYGHNAKEFELAWKFFEADEFFKKLDKHIEEDLTNSEDYLSALNKWKKIIGDILQASTIPINPYDRNNLKTYKKEHFEALKTRLHYLERNHLEKYSVPITDPISSDFSMLRGLSQVEVAWYLVLTKYDVMNHFKRKKDFYSKIIKDLGWSERFRTDNGAIINLAKDSYSSIKAAQLNNILNRMTKEQIGSIENRKLSLEQRDIVNKHLNR